MKHLALLILALPIAANADLITYDYSTTVSAQTDDPLGISGESISLRLHFNTEDTWGQLFPNNYTFLYPS